MTTRSTRETAALLELRVTTLSRAVYEGRVTEPGKAPNGSFRWTPKDIERASWVLRRKSADDVLGEEETNDSK